uniref:C2H2-type domain-containing protein n=1 Tax=Timema tahoe TaxID=61484 RepID=A0A7R9IMM7_9NEOP|nr:unnamed protein product [Timema tahoe]
MKCEDTEEDNGRSMFWFPNSALGHLSFPFIKEEIKNEPDCYATQLKLESTNESVLHSIIKPETTSNAPASGVCEQLGFKEELCFDESFIDNKDYLKKHLLTHSVHAGFKCDFCGKGFYTNGNLKKHHVIHTLQRLYKCDVCKKCFKAKFHLKIHILTHNEQISHLCDVCGKGFTENRKLKIHLFTHSVQRPHRCDYCHKCFKRKKNLGEHLLTHSSLRPYNCNNCGKCFKMKAKLKNHLITHSDNHKKM